MHKRTLIALIVLVSAGGQALAQDPIVGDWLTARGQTAEIAPCDDGFCVTLKTGQYAGRQIGALTNTGKRYQGKVTDPANDRTYNGKATISGTVMTMSGCVLGGLFCRSQEWTKK